MTMTKKSIEELDKIASGALPTISQSQREGKSSTKKHTPSKMDTETSRS